MEQHRNDDGEPRRWTTRADFWGMGGRQNMNNDTTIRRHGTNKTIKKADYLQNKSYQNNHRAFQKVVQRRFACVPERIEKEKLFPFVSFLVILICFLSPMRRPVDVKRRRSEIRNDEKLVPDDLIMNREKRSISPRWPIQLKCWACRVVWMSPSEELLRIAGKFELFGRNSVD